MKGKMKQCTKLRKQDGFTLAELLIVVAIIAVLAAIAIPVFNSQLDKSKKQTAIANLRSAYAEASAAYLTDDENTSEAKHVLHKKDEKKVLVQDVYLPTAIESEDITGLDFTLDGDTTLAKADDAKLLFTFAENEKAKVKVGNKTDIVGE